MDSERIEREAADWLARRDGDRWSESDESAFQDWQKRNTAHRIAVIRLRAVWTQADRLQALGAGVPNGSLPAPGSWRRGLFAGRPAPTEWPATEDGVPSRLRPSSRGRDSRLSWSIAACVVLTAGLLGLWIAQPWDANRYDTTVGGIEVVPLRDGSRVTLNTDSRIRLRWSDSERLVALDRGEAYFEVAKDPARPFVVDAGRKRVIAVGTRFSVRRGDGDDIQVVVTEGRVRIEDARAYRGAPATQLVAGNFASAGEAGVLVRRGPALKAEERLAWRSGYLAFDDTRLQDAVAEFNRYNSRQLVIADPALADMRIGGNLRANNVDAFVRVLEQGFPIDARPEDKRILLHSRQ